MSITVQLNPSGSFCCPYATPFLTDTVTFDSFSDPFIDPIFYSPFSPLSCSFPHTVEVYTSLNPKQALFIKPFTVYRRCVPCNSSNLNQVTIIFTSSTPSPVAEKPEVKKENEDNSFSFARTAFELIATGAIAYGTYLLFQGSPAAPGITLPLLASGVEMPSMFSSAETLGPVATTCLNIFKAASSTALSALKYFSAAY